MSNEFAEMHKWFQEELPLRRLLWYLNAGGRRNWEVIEKPDEKRRDKKMPDYVLRERRTKSMLTVEVTSVPYNPDEIRSTTLSDEFIATTIADQKRSGISVEDPLPRYPPELRRLIQDAEMADLNYFTEKIVSAYQEACQGKFINYKKGESCLLLVIDLILDEREEFLLVNPDLDKYYEVVDKCIKGLLKKHPKLREIEPDRLIEILSSPYFDYEYEISMAVLHTVSQSRKDFKSRFDIDRVYTYEVPTKTVKRLV